MTNTPYEPSGMAGSAAASREGLRPQEAASEQGFESAETATGGGMEAALPDAGPGSCEAPRYRKAIISLDLEVGAIAAVTFDAPDGSRLSWNVEELRDRSMDQVLNDVMRHLAP